MDLLGSISAILILLIIIGFLYMLKILLSKIIDNCFARIKLVLNTRKVRRSSSGFKKDDPNLEDQILRNLLERAKLKVTLGYDIGLTEMTSIAERIDFTEDDIKSLHHFVTRFKSDSQPYREIMAILCNRLDK